MEKKQPKHVEAANTRYKRMELKAIKARKNRKRKKKMKH